MSVFLKPACQGVCQTRTYNHSCQRPPRLVAEIWLAARPSRRLWFLEQRRGFNADGPAHSSSEVVEGDRYSSRSAGTTRDTACRLRFSDFFNKKQTFIFLVATPKFSSCHIPFFSLPATTQRFRFINTTKFPFLSHTQQFSSPNTFLRHNTTFFSSQRPSPTFFSRQEPNVLLCPNFNQSFSLPSWSQTNLPISPISATSQHVLFPCHNKGFSFPSDDPSCSNARQDTDFFLCHNDTFSSPPQQLHIPDQQPNQLAFLLTNGLCSVLRHNPTFAATTNLFCVITQHVFLLNERILTFSFSHHISTFSQTVLPTNTFHILRHGPRIDGGRDPSRSFP